LERRRRIVEQAAKSSMAEHGHLQKSLMRCADVSWTASWAKGAVQSALKALWGVMHHFGGHTDPSNRGPGDVFDRIAPLELPDSG
jgi:hypothetical protein